MAEEEWEVVRQHVALRTSGRRRLLERLLLRSPRLMERLTKAVLRRPPTSTIRRALVRLTSRWGLEAVNRCDYQAAFAVYPPDCETITPPELVVLGFEPTYRGREGRAGFQEEWMRELGEFRQETADIIDTGDRLLLLTRMIGKGLGSGAEFESEAAYLISFSEGRLIREEPFRSHAEALEAAGLRD